MPEPTGAVAEPVAATEIELGPDLSIYGDLAGNATPENTATNEVEATTEEPAGDVSSEVVTSDVETPAPESVETLLAGDETEVITRRNAREIADKARTEERAAIDRATKAEQDAKTAQERLEALHEQARQWSPDDTVIQEIKDAIIDEDYDRLDTATKKVGRENLSIDGAKQLVKELSVQKDRNAGMLQHLNGQLLMHTVSTLGKIADGAGIGRDYEQIADFNSSMTKLITDIRAKDAEEHKSQLEAQKSDYEARIARGGSLSSPERGGQPSGSGAWTSERYAEAVRSGEMDTKSPEERDRITNEIWANDPRGR